MSLAVASRFAVLCLDRDEPKQTSSQKKKPDNAKKGGTNTQKPDPKKKRQQDLGKVQAPNNQNGAKPKVKPVACTSKQQQQKKKAPTQEQWDEWQKKDAEFVDGYYKDDLHQAILLSKLEFEKKKAANDQLKQGEEEVEVDKAKKEKEKVPSKKAKKSNKPQAMSLGEFNNMASVKTETKAEPERGRQVNGAVAEEDKTFFDRIKVDTQEVLHREELVARGKARQPNIDKMITQAQYKDSLEKRDEEILSLKSSNEQLKADLEDVKLRNKKLCHILAQGEMQSKSKLLVELDRVTQMKDELSSELSKLHILLEQERSKNRALTENKRAQNKKRGTSESAT